MVDTKWLKTARHGFNVKRCHTHQIIGECTVGHHTAHAMTILIELMAPYDTKDALLMLKVMLVHDIPEYFTGDNPTHAKHASASLKEELDSMELRWSEDNIPAQFRGKISDFGKAILKAADLLEFMFWAVEQIELGNMKMFEHYKKAESYVRERELYQINGVLSIIQSLDERITECRKFYSL
jgi:5'-deoxynucleotidase YfbR-like HD superfamily hydrolase